MRERRFGALHRYTCGRAACVGVAVTHLRRTSLVHLALRKETRLPIYYACAPRPAMFNKENERIARPTETQPVATAVCTCWRCAVSRPVLLQLENLTIDLRLPPPFKRVTWWDHEPVEER